MTAPIAALHRVARPNRARIALAVLCGAAALASSVALLSLSAWLIVRASTRPPVLELTVAVVGVRFFGISRGVFRYAERLVAHDAAFRSLTRLRVALYERLERLAPAGLPAFRRGDLLARLVGDVQGTQDVSLRVLIPGVAAGLVSVGAVAVAVLVLPAAGAVLAIALLIQGLLVPWLGASLAARAQDRRSPAEGRLAADLVETLHAAPELVALGAGERAAARLAAQDRDLTRMAYRTASGSGLAAGLGAAATGLAVIGMLAVGVPALRAGHIGGESLAILVLLPLAAYEPVAALPAAALALIRTRAQARRIVEVVTTPPPVADPAEPAALPPGPYRLTLRGVGARWPGAAADALSGIDLDLPPGHRVAVVGPSGSGKSTLAAVLVRFLEHDGEVLLNGVATRNLDGDELRTIVGLCGQDSHVFDSTIEENLRIADRDATEARLREALSGAGLLDWVDTLPDGLRTRVGVHGARMSGGQRQRLALARTLLADFPIVVLDEPTEYLDDEQAERLTRDLLDATRGSTTVLVTHRLQGLEDVDEVVRLDGGRVAERGTPSRSGGLLRA